MTTENECLEGEVERLKKRLDRERKARLESELVNERALTQLYQKQNEVKFLQSIAVSANETRSVEEAMQIALHQICAYTRLPVGHLYLLTKKFPRELIPSKIWHLDDPNRFEKFRNVTEATCFQEGIGLPGRVLAEGKPVWIKDVTKDPNFPRAKVAGDIGVRTAVGFPILIGKEVTGVLEFFSEVPEEPDALLLEIMALVGTQLGRVIERKLAEEVLIEKNNHLETALAENVGLCEKLKQQQIELEISSKHKSEFLANMSHELRTPLNAINGFSEVLLEKMFGDLNEKQDEYVQDILDSGRHLLSLINDILDLSKVEAGRMELDLTTFDLSVVVQKVLRFVHERAMRGGIAINSEIDPRLDEITADEQKVMQILLNLASNAVKFTPNGGKVSIQGKLFENHIELSVADTGIGIKPEDQKCIFEEFKQVGNTYTHKTQGTGLGLTLAKKFTELHGGQMWVESEIGCGSRFTFTLPVRAPSKMAFTKIIPAADSHSPKQLVLVVDDNVPSADLLSIHLREAGFEVEVAYNGAEGFEKARNLRPVVISLDILLPDMDGWDLLTQLKSDPNTATIPVVMVSILEESKKGFSLGAAGYLVKPVNPKELIGTVRQLVSEKIQGNLHPLVLLVDDDPMALELLESFLESDGFRVLKAEDGMKALSLAKNHLPDVIVLDLLMPDLDGFQVVDALRGDTSLASIPVIILTAASLSGEEKARLNGRISNLALKGEFDRQGFITLIHSLIPSKRD